MSMTEETPRDQTDELRQRLESRLEEDRPESFVFDEENNLFLGTVKSLRRAPSKFGEALVLVMIEHLTGTPRSIWLHHQVLRNAVIEAAPQPGEIMLIQYRGRVQPEGEGAAYADYRVVVDRDESKEIDWGTVSFGATPATKFIPEPEVEQGWDPGYPEEDVPF